MLLSLSYVLEDRSTKWRACTLYHDESTGNICRLVAYITLVLV
jgi:hypothetical protein